MKKINKDDMVAFAYGLIVGVMVAMAFAFFLYGVLVASNLRPCK